jgi:hypothetical protein
MEAEDSSDNTTTSTATTASDICLERTWLNNELVGDELDLCPRAATATDEDDFNTFYFYQVSLSPALLVQCSPQVAASLK